jgi:epoxyqueuosine reductase
MDRTALTRHIKQKALDLGFLACGISKAEFLSKEAPRLETWLTENRHGSMTWMENHFDKRLDPTLLVDGAKSVISVLLNYYPKQDLYSNAPFKISKYAYGRDYHKVVKKKLDQLLAGIVEVHGDVNARIFTDSAPVLEKAWAERCGLGWIGKNANLISPRTGSFYFIGEIILDVELDADLPALDHCGTCTRCIDACPTDAIIKPYVVDGSKCISYLTIELRDELIPKEFSGKMENWVFGCDICQDVCPWNRFSLPTTVNDFQPITHVHEKDLLDLTAESFEKLFAQTPIKRAKLEGLRRNVAFIKTDK